MHFVWLVVLGGGCFKPAHSHYFVLFLSCIGPGGLLLGIRVWPWLVGKGDKKYAFQQLNDMFLREEIIHQTRTESVDNGEMATLSKPPLVISACCWGCLWKIIHVGCKSIYLWYIHTFVLRFSDMAG